MPPVVYLISGTSRGIGLALVEFLAKRENVFVFAGARKPSSELEAVATRFPGKVQILTLTSGDEADNKAAVAEIERVTGRLDVVIANAAIGHASGSVLETSAKAMEDHFAVNTIGPLVLFQTTYPLLKASTSSPKFVPISSGLGSIQFGAVLKLPSLAYGASKVALNYLAKKLRADHEDLICFPLCPGVVDTEMWRRSVAARGKDAPRDTNVKSTEEIASHILARIDEATRETDAFIQWNGQVRPW